MTVYTASFFQPDTHHGKVLSIARSTPSDLPVGVVVDDKLEFFMPTKKLHILWKENKTKDDFAWEGYTKQYKEETIVPNFKTIRDWIDNLDPDEDLTLCCWETKGHCHRNLVARLIEKRRPEIWGGCDVVRNTPTPDTELQFSYLEARELFLSIKSTEDIEIWNGRYAGTCAYDDFWSGFALPYPAYERICAIRMGVTPPSAGVVVDRKKRAATKQRPAKDTKKDANLPQLFAIGLF